ncbi:hypothetical protein QK290_18560, partial [Pseudarthrobacter sp. AL07]|uniref:hypothetical protein n=1 Tax=unclassified Pseudarthrobacter TaxID=2647000 RepID=UPI00249C8B20
MGLAEAFRGNPVSHGLGPDTAVDVAELSRGVLETEIPEGHFLEGIDVKGSPGFESWLLVERQRVDSEVLSAPGLWTWGDGVRLTSAGFR